MSVIACPFCATTMVVTVHPSSVVFEHARPLCGAWDRVCFAGGFSAAERDVLDALIRRFEPGSTASEPRP